MKTKKSYYFGVLVIIAIIMAFLAPILFTIHKTGLHPVILWTSALSTSLFLWVLLLCHNIELIKIKKEIIFLKFRRFENPQELSGLHKALKDLGTTEEEFVALRKSLIGGFNVRYEKIKSLEDLDDIEKEYSGILNWDKSGKVHRAFNEAVKGPFLFTKLKDLFLKKLDQLKLNNYPTIETAEFYNYCNGPVSLIFNLREACPERFTELEEKAK